MSNTFGDIIVYSLSELSNKLNVELSFLKKEIDGGKLKAKKLAKSILLPHEI